MTSKTFQPSIESIQRTLFAPSFELLTTWIEHPEQLDQAVLDQLENSEIAREEKQTFQQALAEEQLENTDIELDESIEIPPYIQELIERRCDVAKTSFSALPSNGLILLISDSVGPDGPMDIDVANPMAVILNKPTTHKLIWSGWVIAPETDYASYWDMVLDPEQDAPLDPIAGMVQVWNPVNIYLPSIEKVIGELKPKRLQALRALAKEYQSDIDIEDAHESTPGNIGLRRVDNTSILTGSPISGPSDPRWRYQELYHEAAYIIRAPSELALQMEVPLAEHTLNKPLENNIFDPIKSLTDSIMESGKNFIPVPAVNYAMGNNDDDYLLENEFRFIFDNKNIDGKILIEITIKKEKNKKKENTIEYTENGILEHSSQITTDNPQTSFICDPINPSELIISNDNGKIIHKLNLNKQLNKK